MSDAQNICWSCKSLLSEISFFCKDCGIIQPLSDLSPFQLFDLEASFDIDENQLEQNYFSLQHQLHPDRFAIKSAKEKMFASQQSMAINDAYNILKDPLNRADYLIVLKGGKSYKNEDNRNVPPDLLMQSMMQREALSQAKDNEQRQSLFQQSQNRQKQVIEQLKQGFQKDNIEMLETLLLSLQYEQKFMQEIKQKIQ